MHKFFLSKFTQTVLLHISLCFLFIVIGIITHDPIGFYPNSEDDTRWLSETSNALKDEILAIQNKSKTIPTAKENFNSFSGKRLWTDTIKLNNQKVILSDEEALSKIKLEYEAYVNQAKKFEVIINNIKDGKEKFFPDQSTILFKEYIELINQLKSNLALMEKNIKK